MPHFMREEDVVASYQEPPAPRSARSTGTTSTTASSGASSSCAPARARSTSARSTGPRTSSRCSTTSRCSRACSRRWVAERGRSARRVPAPPGAAAGHLGRHQRPQLLRPLLLQRPRPQRRDLRDHRARLLPQPRHQGRLRARPTRRRADRGAPRATPSTTTGSTSASAATGSRCSSRCSKLRVVLEETEGIGARPHLGGLLRRAPGAAARDARRQPGDPERPALRPGRHLVGDDPRRRRGDRCDPGPVGRHARPVVGHPARGRGRARGGAGGPAVRGHVVDLRADALRGVRRGADPPGGPRRLPHAQRLPPRLARRAGRAARLAAGRRSTTPPAPASRPARRSPAPRPRASRSSSRWSRCCRCRSTSAAATAATPTGCTASGRARASPSGSPTTSPTSPWPGGSCSASSTTPRAPP